jgi:phospholipase C
VPTAITRKRVVLKTPSVPEKKTGKKPVQAIYRAGVSSILIVGLVSCSGHSQSFIPASNPLPNTTTFDATGATVQRESQLPTPIQHVVIIFQENRTPDNIFQGVPGADIAKTALDWHGDTVPLHSASLGAPDDLGHSHADFFRDYNNGKMNGFDKDMTQRHHLRPFVYAPRSEVQPYYDMATQYVFADRMFQSNEGPSFPAHLYIVSGTATEKKIADYRVVGNPYNPVTGHDRGGGCDAPAGSLVHTININTGVPGPNPFPCFDRPVLPDFLDVKGVSWRYYQHFSGAGLWHAFDAIRHIRYGRDYANVVNPPETILTDVSKGDLAGVSWVMPDGGHSDHPGMNGTKGGPSWVAAVVNAVGKSKYWQTTAIFVTWDDWGGFYDHVPPPIYNHYELGFRVPLVVISPYAKRGYVSKVTHEFGSILAFSEETFGIRKGALYSTDQRADDLRDAFNFAQKPRVFVPIKAPPFHPAPNAIADEEDP